MQHVVFRPMHFQPVHKAFMELFSCVRMVLLLASTTPCTLHGTHQEYTQHLHPLVCTHDMLTCDMYQPLVYPLWYEV